MHILVGQFIALAALFVTMFFLFMLPFCVVLHSPGTFEGAKYELALSLANCFSGGVFVATFFVGLMPEVRELFELIVETSFPVTETVIFGGFFLALFIEQAALAYRERTDSEKTNDAHNNNNKDVYEKCQPLQHEKQTIPPLISSGSSDECGTESGRELEVPVTKTNSQNVAHGHSHGQHGHSHGDFANLVQGERGIRLFILLLSLGVHSLFEGLALGLQGNVGALFSLFLGVAVHECLVAFALGVNVARMRLPTPTTIKLAVIFSASIPIGQAYSDLISNVFISNNMVGRPKGAKIFNCFSCAFGTDDQYIFQTHVERNHGNQNCFWCKWCGKAIDNLSGYINHARDLLCSEPFDHPCGFEGCSFTVQQPFRFMLHLKSSHKSANLYPCMYCRRLITRADLLVLHLQNECCNRPTSSSSYTTAQKQPVEVPGFSNNQESAVTSSSKETKFTVHECISESYSSSETVKNRQEQNILKRKVFQMHKTKLPIDKEVPNKFCSESDTDDQSSKINKTTYGNPYSKFVSKRKIAEDQCSNSLKNVKLSEHDTPDETRLKSPVIKCWGDWFCKLAKLKAKHAMNKLLSPNTVRNFYICMYKTCSFSTANRPSFTDHLTFVHCESSHICSFCFEKFSHIPKLVDHISVQHHSRKFQCSSCLFRGSYLDQVQLHQKMVHTGKNCEILTCVPDCIHDSCLPVPDIATQNPAKVPKSYNCTELGCNFNTLFTDKFVKHYNAKHPSVKLFPCCNCGYETTNLKSYLNHFRLHNIHNFECLFCSFGVDVRNDMMVHLCINHTEKEMNFFSRLSNNVLFFQEKSKSNSSCRSFSSINVISETRTTNLSLSTHSSSSSTSSANSSKSVIQDCDLRSSILKDTLHLTESETLHTGNLLEKQLKCLKPTKRKNSSKGKKFKCAFCDTCFATDSGLRKHAQANHNLTNRFKCSLCTFTSNTRLGISYHGKSCHNGYFDIIDLAIKMKRRKNKGTVKLSPFSCIFCNYKNCTKRQLIDHMYTELQYYQYSCGHCDFKSRSEMTIQRHYQYKHPQISPDIRNDTNSDLEKWVQDYADAQQKRGNGEKILAPSTVCIFDNTNPNQCRMCMQLFDSYDLLKVHIFRHLQYTPYQCLLCKGGFFTLLETEDHISAAHVLSRQVTKLAYKPIEFVAKWITQFISNSHDSSEKQKLSRFCSSAQTEGVNPDESENDSFLTDSTVPNSDSEEEVHAFDDDLDVQVIESKTGKTVDLLADLNVTKFKGNSVSAKPISSFPGIFLDTTHEKSTGSSAKHDSDNILFRLPKDDLAVHKKTARKSCVFSNSNDSYVQEDFIALKNKKTARKSIPSFSEYDSTSNNNKTARKSVSRQLSNMSSDADVNKSKITARKSVSRQFSNMESDSDVNKSKITARKSLTSHSKLICIDIESDKLLPKSMLPMPSSDIEFDALPKNNHVSEVKLTARKSNSSQLYSDNMESDIQVLSDVLPVFKKSSARKSKHSQKPITNITSTKPHSKLEKSSEILFTNSINTLINNDNLEQNFPNSRVRITARKSCSIPLKNSVPVVGLIRNRVLKKQSARKTFQHKFDVPMNNQDQCQIMPAMRKPIARKSTSKLPRNLCKTNYYTDVPFSNYKTGQPSPKLLFENIYCMVRKPVPFRMSVDSVHRLWNIKPQVLLSDLRFTLLNCQL